MGISLVLSLTLLSLVPNENKYLFSLASRMESELELRCKMGFFNNIKSLIFTILNKAIILFLLQRKNLYLGCIYEKLRWIISLSV